MLNPLNWKPEHRAGLAVGIIGGGALGVAVGFWLTHWSGLRLTTWMTLEPQDVLMWAFIGAVIAGAAVYCRRTL